MLKAVLFDMDQTLIDWDEVEPWEEYQYVRISNVFEYVSRTLHPLGDADPESFFNSYIAALTAAWKRSIETFEPPHVVTVLVDTLKAWGAQEDRIDMEGVLRVYDWQAPPGERAYPEAREVLLQLQAHGIESGIVTNSSHPMCFRDRELRATGLFDLFPRCRVSAADVGVMKPHQAIFARALAILDIQADEAVFVGDSLTADVGGAQRAGMRAVWRVADQDQGQDDHGIIPDGAISTLHDLLPLLDGWYPGWRNGHAR
jgi:putative hydrolase of the HAD superfamily